MPAITTLAELKELGAALHAVASSGPEDGPDDQAVLDEMDRLESESPLGVDMTAEELSFATMVFLRLLSAKAADRECGPAHYCLHKHAMNMAEYSEALTSLAMVHGLQSLLGILPGE